MYNVGDLVQVRSTCYNLPEIEPVVRWSEARFNLGSVGLIIDTPRSPGKGYIKIIAPEGLGWILTKNVEVLG